ncbi:VOC family protein [Tatumella saanichensis]|uniref:VOC family protein n=1 Tax=Tatumella saanichensis TaxID=480813 RepID=UPI0004A340F9|nr:VOC family protein [Tatumella saanichensis]
MTDNTDFSRLLPDLAQDLNRFTLDLAHLAGRLGLSLQTLAPDHISLRCHQNSTAERWAAGLAQVGEMFSQAEINGRPVCLFRLNQPLSLLGHQVSVVELPWPGAKHYPHEGWEHIEVVLEGDPQTLGQRAMALIADHGLTQPGISFKTSQPAAVEGALPNPTLAVTDGKTTLKFHPYSLEAVVASEQSLF